MCWIEKGINIHCIKEQGLQPLYNMNKYNVDKYKKWKEYKITLQVKRDGKWALLHLNLNLSLIDWPKKRKKWFTDGGKVAFPPTL